MKLKTVNNLLFFVMLFVQIVFAHRVESAPKLGSACSIESKQIITKKYIFICKTSGKKNSWFAKPRKLQNSNSAKPSMPNEFPRSTLDVIPSSWNISNCRISSNSSTGISQGFPRPESAKVINGKLRLSVIKVSFPDSPATSKTDNQLETILTGSRDFFKSISYGKLDLVWEVSKATYNLDSNLNSYFTQPRQVDLDRLIQDAVIKADKDIDFSNFDAIVVALPGDVRESIAGVSPAKISGFILNDENSQLSRGTVLAGDSYRIGAPILSHEIGHLLGLPDYYSYSGGSSRIAQFEFMGVFDFMNYAPGKGREPTAWNRWLLNFISDNEVICISELESQFTQLLSPISRNQGIFKMIVIPLSNNRALAIESRKVEGFDSGMSKAISGEGLLVYVVYGDSKSGMGPIKLLRPTRSVDPLFEDALIRVNESLDFEYIRVSNVESAKWGDVVRISRIS